eukprot:CAMPEP_0170066638 /NCGR_PEP_ID=MMETSP0019_2-20121128/6263_1 /TAXON_ID=98059 /ORGANISM="Dinobryon sp., Strain UTEXLB2267" /LENGTH=88 /DNA_ID=CAMNT_0010273783 /DNA_START=149 /DNA_END=415 /DNA_ORIENTATION=-
MSRRFNLKSTSSAGLISEGCVRLSRWPSAKLKNIHSGSGRVTSSGSESAAFVDRLFTTRTFTDWLAYSEGSDTLDSATQRRRRISVRL